MPAVHGSRRFLVTCLSVTTLLSYFLAQPQAHRKPVCVVGNTNNLVDFVCLTNPIAGTRKGAKCQSQRSDDQWEAFFVFFFFVAMFLLQQEKR